MSFSTKKTCFSSQKHFWAQMAPFVTKRHYLSVRIRFLHKNPLIWTPGLSLASRRPFFVFFFVLNRCQMYTKSLFLSTLTTNPTIFVELRLRIFPRTSFYHQFLLNYILHHSKTFLRTTQLCYFNKNFVQFPFILSSLLEMNL